VLKFFKDLVKRLPYPVFLRLFYLKYAVNELRRESFCRRKLHIRPFKEVNLADWRGSDLLFILASGSSINKISAERWKLIAQHDTIGFNFWPLHPFVPKMYFFEAIPASTYMGTAFAEIARRRASDYAKTLKVVTETRNSLPGATFAGAKELGDDLYTVRAVPVAARNEEEFSYGLRYLRSKKLFEPASRIGTVFKQATTLSLLIAFAIRMRYRAVVLCGVDLNHSEYFYQDPVLYPDTASLEFNPRDQPHLTNSAMPWRITVDAVIMEMKRQLLDPEGIRLYVENRSSGLWPRIPEAPASIFPAETKPAGMRERNACS
jgi:hypothetical protein